MFIVFGRDISLILQTHEISPHKNNSHDLHTMITQSLVLVILFGSVFMVMSEYVPDPFDSEHFTSFLQNLLC